MASTTVTVETKISTTTEVVDLTGTNAAKLVAQFKAAKAAIKAMEEQKATAEAALRELLGDAEVGIINGVEHIKVAHSTNSKIDRKALQAGWPEAYEATLVATPYTFLKTI
jgi:predicted phage-related endonuclease